MKVNSVNNNTHAACQNRPQNFGAVKIKLELAEKLRGVGEIGLPRSISNQVGQLELSGVITRETGEDIFQGIQGYDVIANLKEWGEYTKAKANGDTGTIVSTLKTIVSGAKKLKGLDDAQDNLVERCDAFIPKSITKEARLPKVDATVVEARENMFAEVENGTHIQRLIDIQPPSPDKVDMDGVFPSEPTIQQYGGILAANG